MKIIILLMIVMIIISLMFKKELENFQSNTTASDSNSTSSASDSNSTSAASNSNSTSAATNSNSTAAASNSNSTTAASNQNVSGSTTSSLGSSSITTQSSITTSSFEENTIVSFLIDIECDANEQIMTSLRNNVSYLVREALIMDPSYNVSYNCYITENFNSEGNKFVEVVITLNKVYDDKTEKNLLIRNLTNRLQNGITVNDTTYQLKKYDENEKSFLRVVVNKLESKAVTEPSIKYIQTNVNGRLGDILSKNSCVDEENTCNFGHEPYSLLRLDGKNPDTNKKFTENEKNNLITRFNNKCSSNEDTISKRCCDPNDSALDNIVDQLPNEYISKFPSVIVDRCNNKINSMRICRGSNCDDDDRDSRTPTGYEYCKLLNINENDIDEKGNVDVEKLVPDCYSAKCSSNNTYLDIDKKKNMNEIITKHYYLVEAAKNDNAEFLKANYEDERANVNEVLEYGYPGNTILHEVVYYNAERCTEYLLTKNVDLLKVNKDGNSVLHIACLRGNYNLVNRLLKLGASVNCSNNRGDTSLHSAVRSGSYNTVLVVIDNGGSSSILQKNQYGEIPLHTAVVKKLNLNVVRLLVDNGSEIHNVNSYGETIIKSLMKNHKSIARETIRTYLQKKYYEKYEEEEYNQYLEKYPELRPITVDTEVDEELAKNYKDYNDGGINFKQIIDYPDENIRNENLYVDKKRHLIKDKINPKYFNNDVVENNSNDDNIIEEFGNNSDNIEEFTNIDNVIVNNKKSNCFINKVLLLILFIIIIFLVSKKFKSK